MAAERRRFIPALLDVHAQDLAFLWGQRREALTSPLYTLRAFVELGERIEAHLQGLLVAPAQALQERMGPQLESGERDEVFAAASAVLRLPGPGPTHAVVQRFLVARGETLNGLRDALGYAPPALFAADMQAALAQAAAPTAAAAAAVLANHRLLDARHPRLAELLGCDDAGACALAWRAAARADASTATTAGAVRPFAQGIAHVDAAVRDAALEAACWTGQRAVLDWVVPRAAAGDEVAARWLAAIGRPEHAAAVRDAALALPEGPARCSLLARYGHPMAFNALLRWMESPDLPLAGAAGQAFTRITGQELPRERRRVAVAADADDFDREMAPEVWLPDAGYAQALLATRRDHWAAGQRWCRGLCLDGPLARETLLQLDLEARWDAAARAVLAGQRVSAPPPIH